MRVALALITIFVATSGPVLADNRMPRLASLTQPTSRNFSPG
jgi:hypothetical protein